MEVWEDSECEIEDALKVRLDFKSYRWRPEVYGTFELDRLLASPPRISFWDLLTTFIQQISKSKSRMMRAPPNNSWCMHLLSR